MNIEVREKEFKGSVISYLSENAQISPCFGTSNIARLIPGGIILAVSNLDGFSDENDSLCAISRLCPIPNVEVYIGFEISDHIGDAHSRLKNMIELAKDGNSNYSERNNNTSIGISNNGFLYLYNKKISQFSDDLSLLGDPIPFDKFFFSIFIDRYSQNEVVAINKFMDSISVYFKNSRVIDLNLWDNKKYYNVIDNEIKPFNYNDFIKQIDTAGLRYNKNTIIRFISSLISKNFLIITGLSGSGKTRIADAFAKWITPVETLKVFYKGLVINSKKSTYEIIDIDRLGLIVNQGGENTRIFLPFDLIENWIKVIIENNFNIDTPSQTIQDSVISRGIEYSKTLNSFHSPLKALALYKINNDNILDINKTQTCFVSVGADWTNREPLLGFPNALESGKYIKPDTGVLDLILAADEDPSKPYFLILDEMNLSHVERYFADFLSAMESDDGFIYLHPKTEEWLESEVPARIRLPKNLFIIGTVNVDETTYMFSPKVLDRANVIEFRVSEIEMEKFFNSIKEINLDIIKGSGESMGQSFIKKSHEFAQDEKNLKDELMPFFSKLQEAGAEFGYRTATEISSFVKKCTNLVDNELSRDEIIDAAIMQKLLPKLHGSRNRIEKIIKDLGNLCLVNSAVETFPNSNIEEIRYPISFEKLQRMYKRVISDGFTSYAEA